MSRKKREIPWLDKRGDQYYVFWYNAEKQATEKFSLRTSVVSTAQARFAEFLVKGKAMFDGLPEGLLVVDALDHYFFEHVKVKAVAPHTIENNIKQLKSFFSDGTLMRDIGVPECREYIKFRSGGERPVIQTTASKELSTLKAAAYHALTWKRLTLAEMPTFELPSSPASKGVWLYEDELQRLMDGARTLDNEEFALRTLSFIEICYFTASRREAIERLEWSQVDLVRRRIALAKPGEKQTNKRRPTIPIDPKLLPTLERLKAANTGPYVLGSGKCITHWFERAAEIAGLLNLEDREMRPAARLTPHMLRHSRATHLLQSEKSPWAVAGLLGDTLKTVQEVYGHHCPTYTERLFDDPQALAALVE